MKQVTLATLIAPGALAAMATGALAQVRERGGDYYGRMWDDGYGMGHGLLGGAFMLVFWGAVIAVIVVAVRWLSDRGPTKKSSALDILQERLAKGEIDAEEYSLRKKALED